MKTIDKIITADQLKFKMIDNDKSVVYKYDTPVDPTAIVIDKTQQFSLLTMHSLKSLGIMFGYYFTFDNKSVKVLDTFFYIKRLSSKHLNYFSGTELPYKSNYLNLYTSQDGCCLVTGNNLYNIVDREMIRRKKIKNEA